MKKVPVKFQLSERIVGIALTIAEKDKPVEILFRELMGPNTPDLTFRLEEMQNAIFSKIPGLPDPPQIDHLLVLIRPDLSGVAYVNELRIKVQAKANRTTKAGEILYRSDIIDITRVDLVSRNSYNFG